MNGEKKNRKTAGQDGGYPAPEVTVEEMRVWRVICASGLDYEYNPGSAPENDGY